MQKSLMIGITEKDMQAVINTYDLKPYYLSYLVPLEGELHAYLESP